MIRISSRIGLALVILAAVAARPAEGQIVAGDTDLTGTASMDLTLLPGTPFNPTSSAITLDGVSGFGTIVIHRDAQTGTTISATLDGGMYYGSNPALGSYVFGNVLPLTGSDFTASITNVVQNPNDPGFATGQPSSFQSGNFALGGASFDFMFLTGPAAGVELFTDPSVPFSFSSTFDGLPPSGGTVLMNSGPDVLNVLYYPPGGGSIVVAQSFDRTITLVPEPGSLALCGLGGVLAYAYRRRLVGKRPRYPVSG
jgi:hypothetical protein